MLDGLKILFVDDDADVLHLVERFLVHAHAEVIIATSGAKALALVGSAHPDVIVSDISMPDFDGYQFIESIRAQQIHTPAIALTAHDDHSRALEAGFDRHICKPMRAKTLIDAIEELVHQ